MLTQTPPNLSLAVILQQLKPVISGTAEGKDAPAGCMEGTREQLLHDITEWANDPNGPCAFWLSGLAGTGKTTVASSIAEKLVKAGLVVVSFFISRHAGQRSDLYNIVHTLAFELARVNAAARTAILKAFERDPRLHELNLNEQVEHLLLEPLKAVSMANSDARIVLILDALDECDNPAALVGDGCLAKLIPALSCRDAIGKVKVLLTSRPMETIGNALHPFMLRLGREVKLHEIETLGDIHTYLERSMFDLCAHRQLPMSWPSADEISALVKRAGSLFIYAATVIRYISQDEYWPPERLTDLLSTQPASAEDDSPYEEVDKLYLEVMLLFIQRGNRGGSGKQTPLAERVRRVVAAVVLQREPMSPQLISALFHIPVGAVLAIVLGLSAIWSAPASETDRS
ncbi:hypothetical protein BKA62DRAFT_622629 [Auriculariales sp. MPI-PUGE-AT-0066]|nr:hypothetical protein BKA62DRAFT_622629 [Auriculariales sp. MPI-PUGE-AT-0066]